MKIILERKGTSYNMEAKGSTGDAVLLNRITPESHTGTSPMELILEGLAGCSSIDVLLVLEEKQRANISLYKVEVEGNRQEGKAARPFDDIHLHFMIDTDVSATKVLRAIDLSLEKYCSVAKMLEKAAKIDYSLTLCGQKIK
ncbi:MAG: OsmC family protein [Flavobacteriales bacterium]|nr:OsmC family protein [Flavobacteriales bacterium]